MKTFQEFYKSFIFSDGGRQRFKMICEDLVRSFSYDFENPECVEATLKSLIARLNTEKFESSGDVIVSYTYTSSGGRDIYCTMLYPATSILSMQEIKPWTYISEEKDRGGLTFYEMDDISITVMLGCCYHKVPRNCAWDKTQIDAVLGAKVNHDSDCRFMKSVLADLLTVQLYEDVAIDNHPLSFLDDEVLRFPQKMEEEDCDYIDEDGRSQDDRELRRSMLHSFLRLYASLESAKKALIEEESL